MDATVLLTNFWGTFGGGFLPQGPLEGTESKRHRRSMQGLSVVANYDVKKTARETQTQKKAQRKRDSPGSFHSSCAVDCRCLTSCIVLYRIYRIYL
jgi:hypothetical protein